MSAQEIDKLEINIEVNSPDKDKVNEINELADALEKLQNKIKGEGIQQLKDLGVNLDTKSIKEMQKSIDSLQESAEKLNVQKGGGFDEFKDNVEETADNLEDLESEFELIGRSITTLANGSQKVVETFKNLEGTKKVITSVSDEEGKLTKASEKLTESFEENEEKVTKTTSKFHKFLGALKRIALYRAIRAVLKDITQALTAGIQNLALYDKNFNATMSGLKTATTNIKNSLGLMLQPLMEVFVPAVQSISSVFVDIGNEISKATASMKGLSSYTKISSKFAEDYAKSLRKATNFSFDTFNALNSTSSQMFDTEQLDESNEKITVFQSAVKNVQEMLSNVFDIFKTIGSFALDVVSSLQPALNTIFDIINNILYNANNSLNDILVAITPFLNYVLGTFLPEILTALAPISNAVFSEILPALTSLVAQVLPPILSVVQALLPFISLIADLVSAIITPIVEVLAPIIQLIADLLGGTLEMLAPMFTISLNMTEAIAKTLIEVSGLKEAFKGINVIVSFIVESFRALVHLISGDGKGAWEIFKNAGIKAWQGIKDVAWNFLNGIIQGFAKLLNGVIDGINWLASDLSKTWTWLGIPPIPTIEWKANWSIPKFADGGIVGEVWQMNEQGNPEMLFNRNGGSNTSVINQAQLSEAFVQAIYTSGLLDTIENSGGLYIDGKEIAQSRSFKRELNRTNPALNLK